MCCFRTVFVVFDVCDNGHALVWVVPPKRQLRPMFHGATKSADAETSPESRITVLQKDYQSLLLQEDELCRPLCLTTSSLYLTVFNSHFL